MADNPALEVMQKCFLLTTICHECDVDSPLMQEAVLDAVNTTDPLQLAWWMATLNVVTIELWAQETGRDPHRILETIFSTFIGGGLDLQASGELDGSPPADDTP